MSFPGLYNVVKDTEEDWSASSSSVLTSSSEQNEDSDWSDDLHEIKIELSTEEMSISSKGTAGWLHKHRILKSKRKHAEARNISESNKDSAKENTKSNPNGRQTTKSESGLEGTSIPADGKETVKLKRKNSSNGSLSPKITVDHKAEDHQYSATKPTSWSTFFNRGATNSVAPNARYSSDKENEDANNKEIEDDWSATSSSVSTSSSSETDGSDSSNDLEKIKIELSTEEMSTSSKGTVGWFNKHHILKSKRKDAEAKGVSSRNEENATRNHDVKSQSTLADKSVSADRGKTAKAKLGRISISKRSLSSIFKGDHKAKDHQYTAKTTRINGGAAATSVEPNESFSSCVENEDSDCREPPLQKGCVKDEPKNHGRRHHHDTRGLCGEVVDDFFDTTYFLQCLGEDIKDESLKYFPCQSGYEVSIKISSDEASTNKSEDGVTGESLKHTPQLPQLSENEGAGVKEESPRCLPWQTGNEENANISSDEVSTNKSEDHAFYLSRFATAANFSKWLPWQTGTEDNTNFSSDEASTKKSEDHAFYLSRSATAASF